MGNSSGCMYPKKSSKRASNPSYDGKTDFLSSSKKNVKKSDDKQLDDDSLIQQQALAAAHLFQNHLTNGNYIPFNRSTSVVYPSLTASKKPSVMRSSNSRLLRGYMQDPKTDNVETKHFVLVHGGGFGAWCWYKTITLLEQSGFQVETVDLTGSGVSSFDTNTITSLTQYVEPLVHIFHKLQDGEKVILVGHDFGGACISYVMELFPSKISKAIFVAAAMLVNGQTTLDLFSLQEESNNLMQQAQIFLYVNGKHNPPTAVDLDSTLLKDLFFNQTSARDVALASVTMRPIPFAPLIEKLSLTDTNYGSVRRFYITTQKDYAIPLPLQQAIIKSNPPEKIFNLKGSDHVPFFSRPQTLNKILVNISQIPPIII